MEIKYSKSVIIDDDIMKFIVNQIIDAIHAHPDCEIARTEPCEGGVRRIDLDINLLSKEIFEFLRDVF